MSNVIIRNRRIFTAASGGGGSDPALEARVSVLEANEYKITYFEQVSSTSGTVTPPTGATIMLDQFIGGIDAYVSQISGGRPTGDFPNNASGTAVDVSSFDGSGNWTLTGTPSSYPVGIIYVFRIAAVDYGNVDLDYVITVEDFNNVLGLQEIGFGDPTTGRLKSNQYIKTYENLSGFADRTGILVGATLIWNPGGVSAISGTNTLNITTTWDVGIAGGATYPVYLNNSGYFYTDRVFFYPSYTATDYGVRIDAMGLRIGQYSTLSSANTHPFEITNLIYLDTAYTLYTHSGAQSFVQIAPAIAQIGHYSTRIQIFGYSTKYIGFDVNNVNIFKMYETYLTSSLLAGTNDRLMEANSSGDISATKEIIDAFITDATAIGLLEDTANWDILGAYTGTAITGTYEGQWHVDSNYLFYCISDNNWIRLARV